MKYENWPTLKVLLCVWALTIISVFLMGSAVQDGRLTLHGNEIVGTPVWDDIRVPLTKGKLAGGANPDFEVFVDTVKVYAFDAAADQEIFLTVQSPHAMKLNTELEAHMHWSASNVNTDPARFCIACVFADITEAFQASEVELCALCTPSGVANVHEYCDLGDFTVAFSGVSGVMDCRFYRDANHADDDYTADAFVHEVDFHYQIDTMGSRLETSK